MKNIRSEFIKESLLDYENLANTLKENTSCIVKDLLGEAVRDTYNQILSESDEKEEEEDEYEVEEVKDTDSEKTNDAEKTEDSEEESVEEVTEEDEEDGSELGTEGETEDVSAVEEPQEGEVETETEVETTEPNSDESGEWAEFDKYKVSDDEYDFSTAQDEDIVKVYKLLKDTDQVLVNVNKEKQTVTINDNESGNEYLLDLSSVNGNDETPSDGSDEDDLTNDFENMNESIVYEVALNEYDSHVGYTDNYQKKDVMTNPGMSEPGKNVEDWDAGLPKGTKKPWAGKGNSKPFNECGASEPTIEEEDDVMEEEEEVMDEATNVGGFVQQNSTSKSHIPNSNGRKARNSSVAGVKTKSTSEPRYSTTTNESKMMARVNKIAAENKQLKEALNRFRTVLAEAAVINFNLGQIVKLVTENTTTSDEKKLIIDRFGKEAKTVEESKKLYATISRELQSKSTMNINEEKQFTTSGSKRINETPIYQSQDVMQSLDLMHRLCK